MSKDLHNMDDIFNSAYKEFSEDPSPGAWDKISAGLDKKDASSYKQELKKWKRVALFSLFLFGSFVLYETMFKNNPAHPNKNVPVAVNTNKSTETIKLQDNDIDRVQSVRGSTTDVSATTATDKLVPDKVLPGRLNADNGRQYYPRGMVTVPFLAAADNNRSLERDGYSLINNRISSTPERNYADKTAFMQPRHVAAANLNIASRLAAENNSVRSNQLFNPRWTVSAYLSSDRPGYRLDRDGPALLKIKEHEEHQPSFSAGILIAHQIKSRLAVQTGLIYSNTTIVISPEQIYASQNQTGKVLYKYVVSSGYAFVKPGFVSVASPGDSLTAAAGEHSLHYIAVPLVLKYDLVKNKKWILSPGLGIGGNFLTSAKVETDLEGSSTREHVSIRKLDGIRSFNWSLMGDMTLEYLIGRRMSINVRPFFTYALSPITSNNDVETFPYNIGIGAGASYRF